MDFKLNYGINTRAVKPRLHDTTCCQTGFVKSVWQPVVFDNRLYRVYKHSTGCQTRLTTGCIVCTAGCQTGCTTRFDNRVERCSTATVRSTRLSNRFIKPIWQPVGCLFTWYSWLYNRF